MDSHTTELGSDPINARDRTQSPMTYGGSPLLSLPLLFFLLSSGGVLVAQEEGPKSPAAFSAGMGVSYINAPNVVDYLNKYASQPDRVADFTPAVEFFVAPELSLNSTLILRVEYAYLLKSYSLSGLGGVYSFEYSVHMPTAVLDYLLKGDGFYVKLGGGLGYHFGKFSYMFPNSNTEARFTGNGIGIKLELIGNTAFGESLYGLIGGDLRLDYIGALKDDSGNGPSQATGNVKLRFASAGIKFGLVYYF